MHQPHGNLEQEKTSNTYEMTVVAFPRPAATKSTEVVLRSASRHWSSDGDGHTESNAVQART